MTVPIAKVIAATTDATPHAPPTDKAIIDLQFAGSSCSFPVSDWALFVYLGLCLSSSIKNCNSFFAFSSSPRTVRRLDGVYWLDKSAPAVHVARQEGTKTETRR